MTTIVIGAGFFGVAAGAYLRRKGRAVELLDAMLPGSGSRAASGYYNARWYKDRRAIERAAETAEALGVPLTPARARLVRYDGSEGGEAAGLTLIDRGAYLSLLGAPRHAEVTRLARAARGWSVETAHGAVETPSVYLAAGVWTDKLLAASNLPLVGVTPLAGAGLIYALPIGTPPPQPVWRMVTPYRAAAIRSWTLGTVRLCATTETNDNAGAQRAALRKVGEQHLPAGAQPIGFEFGLRPVLPDGPSVARVAPGLYVGTGGGKIGAIYAFFAAERLYSMMQEDGC